MYNFELKKNEKIERILDDIILKTGDDIKKVSVIITNIRFIILNIPSDIESFRVGRTINYPTFNEVIFETDINNIEDVKKDMDYYKYMLSENECIILKSDELSVFLKKMIS